MTNEEARKAWEKLYSEIDKDNWLFVGTINPEMVALAIKAFEFIDENFPNSFIDYLNGIQM